VDELPVEELSTSTSTSLSSSPPLREYQLLSKGSANKKECEALGFGHLIKSVAEWRLNEDETWNQGLRSIASQLKGVADLYLPYRERGSHNYAAHNKRSWVPELHRVVDEAPNSVEGLTLSDIPSSGHTARFVNIWSAVVTAR
jgi:hypothetical protein